MENKSQGVIWNATTDQTTKVQGENLSSAKQRNMAKGNRPNASVFNYMTKRQISEWLAKNPYKELLTYINDRVMGQEETVAVVTNIYNYLKRMGKPDLICEKARQTRSNANNMLLCAPSGCGKTETYRALKDYFAKEIPLLRISITDVSGLTAAGYRGSDPTDILKPFLGYSPEPIGIVLMDEFDKICSPSFNANNGNMHMEVQGSMLTMIEGGKVEVGDDRTRSGISTGNLLFVGIGSFDSFRKDRESEAKTAIGFGQEGSETSTGSHHDPIKREDIIEAGGCYELIGRFSYIVNYHPLDKDVVLRIIEKNRQRIATDFDCDLVLKEQVLDSLCERANSKFGCRLLDSLIRDLVLTACGDALLSGLSGDVLEISLESMNQYTYQFRSFTDEEKEKQVAFAPYNENEQDVSDARMNFEERLNALFAN